MCLESAPAAKSPIASAPPDLSPFFELSADLLCIANYQGYLQYINPAVVKTLGFSREELMSKPIDHFIHPDDRASTRQHRQNLIQGVPLHYFENRYLTKAGETVWLSWTSMPDPNKELIYAVAKNITHKKQLDFERNQLLTRMTTLNEQLKQLSYTTSHDLKAPVNNLLALFSLLEPEKITDPETRGFIDLLHEATQNLRGTLNKYVDQLSQQTSLQIEQGELRLKDVLEDVLDTLRALLEQTHTTLCVDFSALPSLYFNRAYLESIFLNLITNAVKYARPECHPEIHISSRLEGHTPQLIFKDNGQGFDLNEVKERLFGFHQTFHDHPDSKGVGLYLVQHYLNALGGQISLESQPNQGSTFVLSFCPQPD